MMESLVKHKLFPFFVFSVCLHLFVLISVFYNAREKDKFIQIPIDVNFVSPVQTNNNLNTDDIPVSGKQEIKQEPEPEVKQELKEEPKPEVKEKATETDSIKIADKEKKKKKEKPEDKKSNEAAWAKNRRAETKAIVK